MRAGRSHLGGVSQPSVSLTSARRASRSRPLHRAARRSAPHDMELPGWSRTSRCACWSSVRWWPRSHSISASHTSASYLSSGVFARAAACRAATDARLRSPVRSQVISRRRQASSRPGGASGRSADSASSVGFTASTAWLQQRFASRRASSDALRGAGCGSGAHFLRLPTARRSGAFRLTAARSNKLAFSSRGASVMLASPGGERSRRAAGQCPSRARPSVTASGSATVSICLQRITLSLLAGLSCRSAVVQAVARRGCAGDGTSWTVRHIKLSSPLPLWTMAHVAEE